MSHKVSAEASSRMYTYVFVGSGDLDDEIFRNYFPISLFWFYFKHNFRKSKFYVTFFTFVLVLKHPKCTATKIFLIPVAKAAYVKKDIMVVGTNNYVE